MVSLQEIQELTRGRISFGEPLAPLTSFRIGGPADVYIEPADRDELVRLIAYFTEQNFPTLILGNGSNVLVSDAGFRGAVLNLESGFNAMTEVNGRITAGAGARMAKFVDFCIAHGYAGTEMLAGIPGTLGGALVMNAGAYGGEISDHLIEVTVIRNGAIVTLARDEAGFRYRGSALEQDIIVEAAFALPMGDPTELAARRKELLLKRNSSQPTAMPNAGSIFKNPPNGFAAVLIDECGLKGYAIGGARVSEQHANFIVNAGGATASDVVALIDHVRSAVAERCGVRLQLEVRLVGFTREMLDQIRAAAEEKV